MERKTNLTKPSPIMPEDVATSLRLGDAKWDSDGETLVWLEGRSGVGVLVAQTGDDAPRDLTLDLNVRGEVGYGGGDFTVSQGRVYFVQKGSGRIYRMDLTGGTPVAITPDFGRSASMTVSPCGQWLLYVHHDLQVNNKLHHRVYILQISYEYVSLFHSLSKKDKYLIIYLKQFQ